MWYTVNTIKHASIIEIAIKIKIKIHDAACKKKHLSAAYNTILKCLQSVFFS
jgi:DNA-directed RNA polymerase subunit L